VRTDLPVCSSWPAEIDITPDKSKILIKVGMDGRSYDMNNDRIAIFDVASFSLLACVSLNDEPANHKIGFSQDGTKAYVTTNRRKSSSAMLYEISLQPPYNVLDTVPIPGGSWPNWCLIGIAATNTKRYVSDCQSGQVLVFDSNLNRIDSIPVGGTPGTLALTPNNNYLYVLNLDQYISIVNVSADTVLETITGLGNNPRDIEFTKGGSRAYVSYYYSYPEITILGTAAPEMETVSFDIKPGSCPNPLNIKSEDEDDDDNGEDSWVKDGDDVMAAKEKDHCKKKKKAVLPAAILGTADFDVSLIDPTTVTLQGVPALRWEIEDEAALVIDPVDTCDCTEEEHDGYPDLVLKFNKQALIDTLGEVYDGQEVVLTVAGQLTDGTPFEGYDCILIRKHDDDEDEEGDDGYDGDSDIVETGTMLKGNYPNPFNPVTEISFSLVNSGDVKVEIFNVMGQKVATVVDGFMEAGQHTVLWDASDFSSGVYFYRLTAGDLVETRKMMLLK
jgi:hypothetical protein